MVEKCCKTCRHNRDEDWVGNFCNHPKNRVAQFDMVNGTTYAYVKTNIRDVVTQDCLLNWWEKKE